MADKKAKSKKVKEVVESIKTPEPIETPPIVEQVAEQILEDTSDSGESKNIESGEEIKDINPDSTLEALLTQGLESGLLGTESAIVDGAILDSNAGATPEEIKELDITAEELDSSDAEADSSSDPEQGQGEEPAKADFRWFRGKKVKLEKKDN